jgi:hypothetical protein
MCISITSPFDFAFRFPNLVFDFVFIGLFGIFCIPITSLDRGHAFPVLLHDNAFPLLVESLFSSRAFWMWSFCSRTPHVRRLNSLRFTFL